MPVALVVAVAVLRSGADRRTDRPAALPTLAVSAPPVPQAARAACPTALTRLPTTLDGLRSRPVDSTSPYVVAWGEPAVVLRCGVPLAAPGALQPVTVDGVTWQQSVRREAVTWTTVDRAVVVDLRVPTAYGSQGSLLVDLAPAVRALPRRPS